MTADGSLQNEEQSVFVGYISNSHSSPQTLSPRDKDAVKSADKRRMSVYGAKELTLSKILCGCHRMVEFLSATPVIS